MIRRPERDHALGRASAGSSAGCCSTRCTAAVSSTRRCWRPSRRRRRYGPALALEYRRLLVPVVPGQRLGRRARRSPRASPPSAARGSRRSTVLEIPLDLPLSARAAGAEERSRTASSTRLARDRRLLRRLGDPAARARRATPVPAIVRRGGACVAPRSSSSAHRGRTVGRRKRAVFGHTVDYVLKNAPCRVMVTAIDEAA
mgnify:CR=1 FL=1